MAEYIEREAAKAAVCTVILHDGIRNALKSCIDDIHAADVAPVRRGRWVEFPAALAYKDAYCDTHIVCSACEAVFDILDNCTERFNYCPNCGAKMEETE